MKTKTRKKNKYVSFCDDKNTRRRSLCKPLEIEFNNNFFLCKLLRAVTWLVFVVRANAAFVL